MLAPRIEPAEVQAQSIRQAGAGDLPAIARIHCEAFPDTFLTALGVDFLGVYYRLVQDHPSGILLVHESSNGDSGGVDGFVAGFTRPVEFYRAMKSTRSRMAACLIRALLRKPWLAGRIVYHVWRLTRGKSRSHPEECELSSLAVQPRGWNRGIGRLLVQEFLDKAWSKGASCVYLLAEAERNSRVNLFYQRLGFELRECVEQYRGRLLNEYALYRDGK